MRSLLLAVALAHAGCAIDAGIRVTTTAHETCDWQERVVLGSSADQFRLPANTVSGILLADERRLRVLRAGSLIKVRRSATEDRCRISVDGTLRQEILPRRCYVVVEWTARSEDDYRSERLYPVPEELPWKIDWEIKPTPKRVPNGECRLSDIETHVTLVGPDAGQLVFDVAVEDGHVRGEVRLRGSGR